MRAYRRNRVATGKIPFSVAVLMALALLLFRGAYADEQQSFGDVPPDSRCAVCGMRCEQSSPFTTQAVDHEKRLFFCDVGDMLYAYGKADGGLRAFVRDFPSGEWIAAEAAWYVRDEKRWDTPMAWGIAAFRNRIDAADYGEPMDIDAALTEVR